MVKCEIIQLALLMPLPIPVISPELSEKLVAGKHFRVKTIGDRFICNELILLYIHQLRCNQLLHNSLLENIFVDYLWRLMQVTSNHMPHRYRYVYVMILNRLCLFNTLFGKLIENILVELQAVKCFYSRRLFPNRSNVR